MSEWLGLNQRLDAYKASTLTTELHSDNLISCFYNIDVIGVAEFTCYHFKSFGNKVGCPETAYFTCVCDFIYLFHNNLFKFFFVFYHL